MINHSMNPYRYKQMQRKARARGLICVVGGLIVDGQGRVFILKRSDNQVIFPGCWDIPGGQVEEGESLFAALAREIREETGWQLTDVLEEVSIFEWKTPIGKPGQSRLEFDFLVKVQGDLENPKLETGKFSSYRWISLEDINILKENQNPDYLNFFRLTEKALAMVKEI
jgi:8-oxo-dGTP pyrophosphatase MutT (NUDIX family)